MASSRCSAVGNKFVTVCRSLTADKQLDIKGTTGSLTDQQSSKLDYSRG